MNTKSFTLLGLLALVLIVATMTAAEDTAAEDKSQILTGALTLGPAELGEGVLQDLVITDEGLILAGGAISGHYTSVVLDAPFAFNALVPMWSAETPDRANLTVSIRTSKNGDRWSDWIGLVPNNDWMTPEDKNVIGQMIAVPGEDGTHGLLQFSADFSRYADGPSPLLQALNVTFFDSTEGPTAAEMVARQETLDAEQVPDVNGYPKPSVIGRDTWCTDPACNYSAGLYYKPVSHLIVHHTVNGNSSTNWAAIVRAIWAYHTLNLEWGDIGYNYLVDMNGVIYEGHLGGDDVIGTHAAGANAGSMALAFIGTFTTATYNPPGISPPAAMRNSAIELFAWKADQRDIDVHGSGYLPDVDWTLPNLMGHRDVYGTTQCPGDQAYDLLPWLRDQVAGKVTISTIYVDELSAAFSKNNVPGWHVATDSCGDNGHAYYAWSTQDPGATINRGEWRPNLDRGGFYELQASIPYCITGAPETDGATYTIGHVNGESTVTLSQEDHVRTWMSLGTFEFAAGNSTVIKLSNLTQTDNNLGVWFDALRFIPANTCPLPSIHGLSPASETWFDRRDVTFNWSIVDGQAIQNTRLEVATDPNFTNLVFSQEFAGQKNSHAVTFAQEYNRLFWRVTLSSDCHQVVTSGVNWLGIDTIAPASTVSGVFLLEGGRILPGWVGQDNGAGIIHYNIDRATSPFNPAWVQWLTGYPFNSAFFDPPTGADYWFRSQATDAAGNVEPLSNEPDAGTIDAIPLHRAIMFPLIFRR